MHPFYFGTTQKPLFGVYHAAEARPPKPVGVVVCAPTGHEYIRSYRALRNLSAHLARAGCHVLRFDYFGTGDSAGDGREVRVGQWLSDIGAAIEELKDTAGVSRVSLVGLRFGAALAALAVGNRKDIEALVLWDPVLRGTDYVEGMLAVQRAWLETRPQLRLPAGDGVAELLGFPLGRELRQDLEGVDLWRAPSLGVKRVAVVTTDADPEIERWSTQVASAGVCVNHRRVANGDEGWNQPEAVHLAFLPQHALLQDLVAEACGERR